MEKVFLGIDIGSYESKGVVVTQSGKVIAYESLEHRLSLPKPGYVEHDADVIWWHDFATISKKLLASPNVDRSKLAAVGVSAIAPCVLPIDQDGRPLRPAILYGIDNRATAQIDLIERTIGVDRIHDICGQKLSAQSAGPKILWVRQNEPEIWEKTWKILTGSGYLAYKLTGRTVLDKYTASAYSPLFDVHTLAWSNAFEDFIPARVLPELMWTTDIAGRVNAQAAIETGIPEGIPVTVGTADAAAESLSAGLSEAGDMMLMYGSSTFLIQKTHKFVFSDDYAGAVFLQEGHFVQAGGVSTAGSLTRWFRDQFGYRELQIEKEGGINAYANLSTLAQSSPRGANGLTVLPFFSGRVDNPGAKGLIYGLNLMHTRADIYRAILESIGYLIRENIEKMAVAGGTPARIFAVGGGIKNRPWLQIVSDITGMPQYIPDCAYGASFGDAFTAAIVAGEFKSISEIGNWVGVKEKILPDASARSFYDNRYVDFNNLYVKLFSS